MNLQRSCFRLTAQAAIVLTILASSLACLHAVAAPKTSNVPPPHPIGQSPSPADITNAQASIIAQLKDFKKGDWTHSLIYQSQIRRRSNTPASMRAMIQGGYPEFANYRSIVFGPARSIRGGQSILVPVILVGQDRVKVNAIYMMVKEGGMFRVLGVQGGMPKPIHMMFPTNTN